MTDVEFNNPPQKGELEDTTCRWERCGSEATIYIKFRQPRQYIPYCSEHGQDLRTDEYAQYTSPL